jgi:hypothetical protein
MLLPVLSQQFQPSCNNRRGIRKWPTNCVNINRRFIQSKWTVVDFQPDSLPVGVSVNNVAISNDKVKAT